MARVALLLIKGLSHKEIATPRAVSERTVWEQALDLLEPGSSRTALSAFFLEDLLAPSKAWNSRGAVRMQRTARCAEARTRRTGLSDWVLTCALGVLHPGVAAPCRGRAILLHSMKSRTPQDAVRLACEGPTVDIALALAQEVCPKRSDRDGVDPEQDEVLHSSGRWDEARYRLGRRRGAT